MASMLCPVLIDRASERNDLADAVGRAAAGRGGLIVVSGEPGVGKSRLAAEASVLASGRGFQVLSGRATESAVPTPLRPVTEALMTLARSGVALDTPPLAPYRHVLGTLLPEWRGAEEEAGRVSPLMLGEAMLRLLIMPGRPGRLMVLEDLQWADPETLEILDYLADNLRQVPVLCVATLRDSQPSAALDLCQALCARRAALHLALRRFSADSVRDMAAACLDTAQVPPAVREALEQCDGLPFAVEEVLATAASSGQLFRDATGWHLDTSAALGVPPTIAASVRSRMSALPPPGPEVLASAALLGRQFDSRLVPAISDVSESDVLAVLQAAHDLQLIERAEPDTWSFRFRHSLTRSAVLADLLAPDLTVRASRAAAAVEAAHPGLPGNWCELAADLHGTAGNTERSAELLLEVGHRAARQGALGTAASSLRKARAALPADAASDLVLDVDEALVTALSLAGAYSELAAVTGRLVAEVDAAGTSPRRQARAQLLAARARSPGDPAAAAVHLEAARAIAERVRHPTTTAWVDAIAARCAVDTGRLGEADVLAHRALASAEKAGLTGWAADVAFDSLEVIGRREQVRNLDAARAALTRACQIDGTDENFAIRRIVALHELGVVDMLSEGTSDRLSEARAQASRARAMSTVAVTDLDLARVLTMSNQPGEAIEAAQRCEHEAGRLRMIRVQALAASLRGLALAVQGASDEATLAAEHAEGLAPEDAQVLASTWGETRVTALVLTENLRRAVGCIRQAVSFARQNPLTATYLTWGYWSLLSASLGPAGRGALADARAANASVNRVNAGLMAYAEAVLEGRDGHRDQADRLASRGSALLEPFAPLWNHLARRLTAPSAFKDGWGEPADWLRGAAADFDRGNLPRPAAACRGLLHQAGEKAPRSGRSPAEIPAQLRRLGITSREVDVLLLLARGLSNAEIAERLFISPKTVETHVASLVAKTGNHGRRELVAQAARYVSY